MLRSPYAHRRNIKRRKNLHDKEGAFQYIVRKYGDLSILKSMKYSPLSTDPSRVKLFTWNVLNLCGVNKRSLVEAKQCRSLPREGPLYIDP